VRGLWSDGVHVFAAAETAGVYAYAYDGAAYREIDRVDAPGEALGVVGDGTYLYVGDGATGVIAYAGFRCRRSR
jgi:glutamine cyclotransferase